jgi:hypothetical protein
MKAMMPTEIDAAMAPAKKRGKTAAKSESRKTGKPPKLTVVSTRELDFRLDCLASFLKMDKSALARKLLDQGMRAYQVDGAFRAALGQSEGSASSADGASESVPALALAG